MSEAPHEFYIVFGYKCLVYPPKTHINKWLKQKGKKVDQ